MIHPAPIDKYRKMVENLYDLTLTRKLVWEVDFFSTSPEILIADRKISIDTSEDADGNPLIIIHIDFPSANRRHSFTDEDLSGAIPTSSPYTTYYELMTELRDMAIRNATGADEDIDAILDKLSP